MTGPPRRAGVEASVAVALIGVVTALHLFVNGTGIATRGLWYDEAHTFAIASHPFPRFLKEPMTSSDNQPPLYYALMHFLLAVRTDETSLRAMSWLFALGILLVVLLGAHEFRRAGRITFCALFFVSTFGHYLAQEARPYALATLTSFVATILFQRYVDSPESRGWRVKYPLAAFAMLYSMAFNIVPFAVHVGYVLVRSLVEASREGLAVTLRRRRASFGVLAGLALAYVPYVVVVKQHQFQKDTTVTPRLGHLLGESLDPRHFASALREFFSPVVAIFVALLIVLGFFSPHVRRRWPLWVALLIGSVIFTHGFLLGTGWDPAPRYWAPSFPIVLWLASAGVDHLVSRRGEKQVAVLLTLALLLWCGIAYPAFAQYLVEPLPLTDWRGLYASIRALPGEKVVVFESVGHSLMFRHVARADNRVIVPPSSGRVDERRTRLAMDRRPDASCFFYVRPSSAETLRIYRIAEASFESSFAAIARERGMTKALHFENAAHSRLDNYVAVGFCKERP